MMFVLQPGMMKNFHLAVCIMHETGHGTYEQGLEEHEGTPCGKAVSLGVHESQSRMWENMVGRSIWQFYIDDFKACFPHLPDDLDVDTLHRAVNTVQPSLIGRIR